MQQVKGAAQAVGQALQGAGKQPYKGGGSARAGPAPGGTGAGQTTKSGGGGGCKDTTVESYHDEELSFIEPVFATRTAIHPAPQRELPQVGG